MTLFNYDCDEVKRIIEEVSPNYPQLTTYEKEWLYFYKYGYIPGKPVELEYETVPVNPTGHVSNAIPFNYKSAILKGQTLVNLLPNKGKQHVSTSGTRIVKYPLPYTLKKNTKYLLYCNVEDISTSSGSNSLQISMYSVDTNVVDLIDTIDKTGLRKHIFTTSDKDFEQPSIWFFVLKGETTEAIFDEVMMLEYQEGMENWDIPYFEGMQSVKMPVLTTSNEDGTKTNILTVNEDVTLRSNGVVYDELNLLTGRLTQRIDENNEVLSQEVVKTVDLTPLNTPYEGTNHYELTSNIPCEAILEVPVVSTGKQTIEEINN